MRSRTLTGHRSGGGLPRYIGEDDTAGYRNIFHRDHDESLLRRSFFISYSFQLMDWWVDGCLLLNAHLTNGLSTYFDWDNVAATRVGVKNVHKMQVRHRTVRAKKKKKEVQVRVAWAIFSVGMIKRHFLCLLCLLKSTNRHGFWFVWHDMWMKGFGEIM